MQCNIASLDLPARLNGTVCMYDNVPYFVGTEDSHRPIWIYLYDLMTKSLVHKIKPNDPLFDIATPPLGYLQIKKNRAVWSERIPHRQFRQGITLGVLHFEFFNESFRMNIHSEYFKNTMMKVYPTLPEVLKTAFKDPDLGEYSLSNDCALVKSVAGIVKIYFKHEEVAFSSVPKLKKKRPMIHVPSSTKSWITEKYLSKFDWDIAR